MAKFVVGTRSDRLYEALLKHGVVSEPAEEVSRVVIDLRVGHPARLYLEKYLDDSVTDVLLDAGIREIEEEEDA